MSYHSDHQEVLQFLRLQSQFRSLWLWPPPWTSSVAWREKHQGEFDSTGRLGTSPTRTGKTRGSVKNASTAAGVRAVLPQQCCP
jgi:hypothetical protein